MYKGTLCRHRHSCNTITPISHIFSSRLFLLQFVFSGGLSKNFFLGRGAGSSSITDDFLGANEVDIIEPVKLAVPDEVRGKKHLMTRCFQSFHFSNTARKVCTINKLFHFFVCWRLTCCCASLFLGAVAGCVEFDVLFYSGEANACLALTTPCSNWKIKTRQPICIQG